MSITYRLTDLLTYRANTRGPSGPKNFKLELFCVYFDYQVELKDSLDNIRFDLQYISKKPKMFVNYVK